MQSKNKIFLAMFFAIFVTACSTSVQRLDAEKEVDLSGAWNDSDSQLVAKEMIDDSLSRAWLKNFVTSV